jgi:2-polyprenyl-3-methyl-5-hydroxy-6-metoxy-1,4-benzoquinol methylase
VRRPGDEEARKFLADSTFAWYQQFELAPGVMTPGVSPTPSMLAACDFPADLTGLSVLDIGTANGAVAFEAERRGARRVVAVDLYDEDYFGFGALKAMYESKVEFVQCSVYELPHRLAETFDVIAFLGVLYHLRHPLLGLDALRRISRGVVYLETAVSDATDPPGQPTARFHRFDDLAGDPSNWWTPTSTALDAWCRSAGFDVRRTRVLPAPGGPSRCIAELHMVPDTPEYLCISYEQPVFVGATAAAGSESTIAAGSESKSAAAASAFEREADPRLPPAPMRLMVAGTDDAGWFVESGRRSVADLERALAAANRTLESFTDVLDFGCGCGRMSRWLLERGVRVTGVDIEAPLIEWCRTHLPEGTFEVDPPLPPTHFADHTFDLVVNHSVFTHLDEEYQDQWLAELARIARPNGLLVLSFSGEGPFAKLEEITSAVDAAVAAQRRAEFDARGIVFIIDDTSHGFPDFYHATFHKPEYVMEHWGRWFEVLAHLPRNNLDFQDAVVVRPLASRPS